MSSRIITNERNLNDFSYQIYRLLILSLLEQGYQFLSFIDYLSKPLSKSVILRHDIDIFASAALPLAELEHNLGVSGTYYFRTSRHSFRPDVILKIAKLNHEIGYHYEDLSRNNGDMVESISEFGKHLSLFRKLYPVKTICMHGSSGSPYDNRELWKHYQLADFGLIGEPYISLDFNRVLYMSDTTQRWDGGGIAVRDKVVSDFNFRFRTTKDILCNINSLPDHIMITIHPELWAGNLPHWLLAKLFVMVHGSYKKYYRNIRMSKRAKQIAV